MEKERMDAIHKEVDRMVFAFEESADQSNLFTSHHIKYDCTLTYNGLSIRVPYQCNEAMTPTKMDVLDCLVLDAISVEDDLAYFLAERYAFGEGMKLVENLRLGICAYDECKKTREDMDEMLSPTLTVQDLCDYFSEIGW